MVDRTRYLRVIFKPNWFNRHSESDWVLLDNAFLAFLASAEAKYAVKPST